MTGRCAALVFLVKVKDCNLPFLVTLGCHHFHDLLGAVRSSVDIVHRDDQVTREDVSFKAATWFNGMDSWAIFCRVNDYMELAWWREAVSAYNT